MELRKIEDEADARRCLAAVKRAGGDLRAWTRAHRVDGRSLNLWRLHLERRAGQSAPATSRPAQLSVVELIPARPPRASHPARYAMEVAGVRLELGDDFQDDTLRRLVRVLRSC